MDKPFICKKTLNKIYGSIVLCDFLSKKLFNKKTIVTYSSLLLQIKA